MTLETLFGMQLAIKTLRRDCHGTQTIKKELFCRLCQPRVIFGQPRLLTGHKEYLQISANTDKINVESF